MFGDNFSRLSRTQIRAGNDDIEGQSQFLHRAGGGAQALLAFGNQRTRGVTFRIPFVRLNRDSVAQNVNVHTENLIRRTPKAMPRKM